MAQTITLHNKPQIGMRSIGLKEQGDAFYLACISHRTRFRDILHSLKINVKEEVVSQQRWVICSLFRENLCRSRKRYSDRIRALVVKYLV
jgi:hypothetical protein